MKTCRLKIAYLFLGCVLILTYACSPSHPTATPVGSKVSQTAIPISTLNTPTLTSSMISMPQAITAARKFLDTSRLSFSLPPAVVFAQEMELTSALQYAGWIASTPNEEPGSVIVWLVVFEAEAQVIPPDPLHTMTPLPPTHDCTAVIISARDGTGVELGVIDCPASLPTQTVSPVVGGPPAVTTAEPTPGLIVFGKVIDSTGAGIENVSIYRSYASYAGAVIATTDAKGYFISAFYPIPGDENVTLWAVKPGFTFVPEYCHWRHYYGFEKTECNFQVKVP